MDILLKVVKYGSSTSAVLNRNLREYLDLKKGDYIIVNKISVMNPKTHKVIKSTTQFKPDLKLEKKKVEVKNVVDDDIKDWDIDKLIREEAMSREKENG